MSTLSQSPFLRACRKLPNKKIPVWLMRQAGRYMAEYQAVRSKVSFLELCKSPELSCKVTIDAAKRLGVDAGIIFSDILLIVEAMGLSLEYHEGKGPLISPAIKMESDINKLKSVNAQIDFSGTLGAIKLFKNESPLPLIGFCGAPYTVAAYMIEGGSSKSFEKTRKLMTENTVAWNLLMDKITEASADYLNAQLNSGCDALQIFDSWVGSLSIAEYEKYVFPFTQKLISQIKKDVPVIHFGTHTEHLLPSIKNVGASVISLDDETDIKKASDFLADKAIQGNLNSKLLFEDIATIKKETLKILDAVGNRPGFIFNLGHGILPTTPVENVIALVDIVHEYAI